MRLRALWRYLLKQIGSLRWALGGVFAGHRLAQSVGVVAFVGDQHRVFRQIGDQLGRASDVAGLAGGQFELDRPPLLVDERVDFGGESASGTTQTSILTPLFAVAPCWWTRTM